MKNSNYSGYTEARKSCNAKYRETLESIQVYVKKGEKEKIKNHAKERNMSINQFITTAIEKFIGGNGNGN